MATKELRAAMNRPIFRRSLFLFSVFLGLTVLSATGLAEEAKVAPNAQGLEGILPAEVPDGLSADAFAVLDGNWKEWSQRVGAQVTELYENLPSTVAAQRELIETLKSELPVMKEALGDPRYGKIFDPLAALYGRMSRRLELAEAILVVLQQDPRQIQRDRVTATRQQVVAALDSVRAYLTKTDHGAAWLSYLHADELNQAAAVDEFSESDLQTVQDVLRKLQGKAPRTTEAQKTFLEKPQLTTLRSAIESLWEAVQQLRLKTESRDADELRRSAARLVVAAEACEVNNSSANAIELREAYNQLQEMPAYDIEPIVNALTKHYFNYNLRIIVSEEFLGRVISKEQDDDGSVNDFILGARVGGNQWTHSRVSIDLKPNDEFAQFDVTLNGTSQSQTQGVTDQATIYTSGYHTFWAAKQVTFDGDTFDTQPARISVNANNTTTGASTKMNGVPIFGAIARQVAVNAARRKRRQSEAIAVDRVSRRVVPEFNSRVDEEFSKASKNLVGKLNGSLKDLDLYPNARSIHTTEETLLVSTRLMETGELAANPPNPMAAVSTGMAVHLHQSLLNNSLDRLKLAGRTVTEEELATELEKSISTLLGDSFKFSDLKSDTENAGGADKQEEPATLMFAEADPIRIRVDNGSLILVIRTGLKQGDGKEDIPTQVITVPLELKVDGDAILIQRGSVSVSPVDRPKSRFTQIARAGIVRKKIQSALPDCQTDRFLHIQRSEAEPLEVAISEIKAVDGWLSVIVE